MKFGTNGKFNAIGTNGKFRYTGNFAYAPISFVPKHSAHQSENGFNNWRLVSVEGLFLQWGVCKSFLLFYGNNSYLAILTYCVPLLFV